MIRDKCIGTYRAAVTQTGIAVCPVCGAKFNAKQGRAFMPVPVHRPKGK
jgi:predicted HNH restriction endonuclease